MSSSFSFKLRRHKARIGAKGYDKESWHERTGRNDQRQGKNDHCNSSKAKTLQMKVLAFCAR